MRFEEVLIRCDLCGREFRVSHGSEDGCRYELPTLSSEDHSLERTRYERAEVDLCNECLKKVTVVRRVVETEERYVGGHDMYARVPTGRVRYNLLGD